MAEHFDPYHKWLGIPLKDQPPNHYRLLGVDRFETDREVIDAAANRLMAYLQDLSTGDQAAAAQRLLNQIAAARLLLLTPDKKAAYDEQLRAESAPVTPVARPIAPQSPPVAKPLASGPLAGGPMAPAPEAPQVAPPGGGPIVVADDNRGRRPSSSARGATRPTRKQPSLIPIVVLGVAALFVAAIATIVLTRTDPTPPKPRTSGAAANPSTPSQPTTRIRFLIDETARDGLLISIDGRQQPVAERGELNYPAKAGPTTIVIRRRGYQTINKEMRVTEGVTNLYEPKFEVDAEAKAKEEQFDIPSDSLDDLSNAKPGANDDAKIDEPDLDD